MKCEEEEEDL